MKRWWLWLGVIAVAGLGVRVAYVLIFQNPVNFDDPPGDPFYYHHAANLLADGHGFVHPFDFVQDGVTEPGGDHPPGYIVYLAMSSLVGFRTFLEHQLWSCVLGAGTVAMVGVAGREIAGPRTGLIAAGITAVYPNFWFFDAEVLSETMVQFVAAVTVVVAYRFWRRPTPAMAAGLGVAVGVATLTRSESIVLVGLLIAPLACMLTQFAWKRRLQLLAVGTAATVVVISPWVIPNLFRFEEPVTLSTTLGPALVVANCDDTYYEPWVGWWSFDCINEDIPPGDASEQDLEYRERGLEYISDHKSRVPVVVLARIGRTFGLYAPSQQIFLDQVELRELEASRVGLFMYYSLLVASVFGAITLRRRKVPLTPLLALIGTVLIAVTLTFGQTRYRAGAEVAFVLLAAVAFDAALRERFGGRDARA